MVRLWRGVGISSLEGAVLGSNEVLVARCFAEADEGLGDPEAIRSRWKVCGSMETVFGVRPAGRSVILIDKTYQGIQ